MCSALHLLSNLSKFVLQSSFGLLFIFQLLIETLHLIRQLLLFVVGTNFGTILFSETFLYHEKGRGGGE